MPWVRMNIDVIQSATAVYSGHVLKAYEPGTTTDISIATDKDGTNTYATLTTNSAGVFEVGSNEVLPYIDQNHKWALFANATDATNNTNPVLGFFDNVSLVSASNSQYTSTTTITQRFNNLDVDTYAAAQALDTTQLASGDTVNIQGRDTINDNAGGPFVWTSTDLSASVTSDPQFGIFLPPTSDVTGASGAFVRRFSGALNVLWFGAKGDGSTDDITAINAAITYTGGLSYSRRLYFPAGRYNVSARVEADNYNDLILEGDGAESQIYPSTTGYDTILIGFNNVRCQVRDMGFYAQDSQVALDWEGHQGGIFRVYVFPVASPADACTGVRLNQTTGSTGSWITDVQNFYMDFNQASTATDCTGIELVGATNRVNVNNCTFAGFNGTGLRQKEYSSGNPSQMISITGCDFESMTRGASTNYAIDIQGQAQSVYIHDNYFEGIDGTNSRFLRLGNTAVARNVTFYNNHCLTSNPLPTGFKGIDIVNAISPDIYQNFFGPAGAGEITISGSVAFGLSNQLDVSIKSEKYLLEAFNPTPQFSQVAATWEEVTDAKEFTRVKENNQRIWEFIITYEPAIGTGETYSFRLQSAAGSGITESQIDDTPSGTTRVTVSKIFTASINDLGKIQFQCDTAQTGPNEGCAFKDVRILSYSE